MQRQAGMLVSLTLVVGASWFAVQPPAATAAGHAVAVVDNAFQDAVSSSTTTTITAGDYVTWTWSGTNTHSVTADDATFDSDPPAGSRTSGTFTQTFSTPGSYGYYCRIHGAPGRAMAGTIVVQVAAPTSTPTSLPGATVTPAPSNTPVTRTPAPNTTDTPVSAATSAPALTPVPALNAPASATPGSMAAAGGAAQLPRTGFGRNDGATPFWPVAAFALGLAGLGCGVARRTRRHRP